MIGMAWEGQMVAEPLNSSFPNTARQEIAATLPRCREEFAGSSLAQKYRKMEWPLPGTGVVMPRISLAERFK